MSKFKDERKEDIVIRQILTDNGVPKYVEWFSHTDSRNHILSVDKFKTVLGYSDDEIRAYIASS